VSGRERFVLDVRGPGRIYVLYSRLGLPTYAQRAAGPFGNEASAVQWIENEVGRFLRAFDACSAAAEEVASW
jgi:hypothetical protein